MSEEPTISTAPLTSDGPDAPAMGASFDARGAEPRPEILVGAAFAGGLMAALILRRLGR